MKLNLLSKLKKNLVLTVVIAFILGTPLGLELAKKYEKITYAHGLFYLGPNEKVIDTSREVQETAAQMPSTSSWQSITGVEKNGWIVAIGQFFPYLLSYPKDLNLKHFPGDQNDSIGIETDHKKAYENLLLHVETISSYDPKLTNQPEAFVGKYWTFYSGLLGLKELKEFTNPKGLKGYQAQYFYKDSEGFSTDVFFVINKDTDHLVHLIKGDLGQEIFEQIVNRFDLE